MLLDLSKNVCPFMKSCINILCTMFAAVAISNLTAKAALVDITVNDGLIHHNFGDDPRTGDISEYRSVSDPAVNTPVWDLRAFVFDTTTSQLTVVSGFNPLGKLDNFGLGDIFIDTNNSFTATFPLSSDLNSAFGFEYAIDLKNPWSPAAPGQINYEVLSLSSDTQFQLPSYGNSYPELAKGAPVLVKDLGSGSSLSPGLLTTTLEPSLPPAVDLTMTALDLKTKYGVDFTFNGTNSGEKNYVFTFDLSAISFVNGATFRLTQECGNDLLVGQLAASPVVAVPETSTWVMGFLALGAVVFLVRRNRQTAA